MARHQEILNNKKFKFFIYLSLIGIFLYGFFNYLLPNIFAKEYSYDEKALPVVAGDEADDDPAATEEVLATVAHIAPPDDVRGLYMTSWVAGTKSIRDPLVQFIDISVANAVVIDIKDYTGRIAIDIHGDTIDELEAVDVRVRDMEELIQMLHEKNIYIIGRVAVFQDPYLVKKWPEDAVKTNTDKTVVWKDRKGISWMDAGSERVWDYHAEIAEASYAMGFDEINFDYIRFPSDGNMNDIYFPHSQGKVKSDVMNSFFTAMHDRLSPQGIPISADLFGMTTTNTDDLGIGQILEHALVNFDYVSPMVYPSHYPATWNGYANPASMPYEVIHKAMTGAVAKAEAIGVDKNKLRPWLQDFDLGAVYTKEMVQEQIQATYDVGLDSYLMWDPSNKYTKDAYSVDMKKTEDTGLQSETNSDNI